MPSVITAFSYKKTRTFDTRTTGGTIPGGIASNLVDFPVRVQINSTTWADATERGHFFGAWNVAGKRCQFFDSNETTNLPYEVEYYDAASETAVYWIKVPQIDGNSNTDKILIAYGNDPNSSDQSQGTSGWNSGYVAAYHMGDNVFVSGDTTTEVKDSTANALHADNIGSTDVAGKVRRGRLFDGVDDSVTLPSESSFPTGDRTWSAWIKTPTLSGTNDYWFLDKSLSGSDVEIVFYLQYIAANDWRFMFEQYKAGSNFYARTAASSIASQTEYFVAGTISGSTWKVFIDGADATAATAGGTPNINNTQAIQIAKRLTTFYGFPYIDEIRCSNVARSADWLKLEYHDINNDAWATWAAEQSAGGILQPHYWMEEG